MPTAQQKQSEFVQSVMFLAACMVAAGHSDSEGKTCLYPDAHKHLKEYVTAHAQQQAAVVGALVEALEGVMDGNEYFSIQGEPEDWHCKCIPSHAALDKARAALALVNEANHG